MGSDCRTTLHKAVEDVDVEKVRQLVLDRVNVNARDDNGQIPMPRHPSLLQNVSQQVEILELLVKAGADLASYDSNKDMQVADILRYGKRELVRMQVLSKSCVKSHLFLKCVETSIDSLFAQRSMRLIREWLSFFFKNGFESHNTHFAFLVGACIYEYTEEIIEVIALLLEYKVDSLADFCNILTFHQKKLRYSKMKPWPVIKQVVALITEYSKQYTQYNGI